MRIEPGVAPRLHFFVLDADGVPDATVVYTDVTTAKYRTRTAGVASADSTAITLAAGAYTDSHATGTFGLVNTALGEYFVDCPVGAADANADTVELRMVLTDGTLIVIPVVAEIDVRTSTRNATAPDNAGIAAIKERTDNLPDDPADVGDVSPTIDFSPTINPTELSNDSVNAIRSGLSTLTAAQVWDYIVTGSTSAATTITTLLTRIVGTLASGTHSPQSGDSYARLGAPAGDTIAADIAAIGGGVDESEIIDGVLAGLDSVTVTRVGPGFDPVTSAFELIAGDDYVYANDGHTDFSVGFTGDPEGWSVAVGATAPHFGSFTGVGSLVQAGSEYKLRVEWEKDQTAAPPSDGYQWQAKLIDPDGMVRTKIYGALVLKCNTVV